jgi:hypothetical protein
MVGGTGIEENLKAARFLEERGLIDYVNISIGNYQTFTRIVAGMHEPMGYELPTSTPISRSVRSPTIVTGRFRTLEEGDQVIRRGDASMVSFVRALIADPDMVAKSAAGRADEVRPCIACNQGCLARAMEAPYRMGCAINPGAGFELTLGDERLVAASVPKRVLVVGGGPAGMEAARVAALRGHKVTLAEAGPNLGGAMIAAARAPTRHGMGDFTLWQEREIYRLGVEVRLSTYLEADDIGANEWDTIIVATGSVPRMDGVQNSNPGEPIEGIQQAHVISSSDLMLGSGPQLGQHAVVIDDAGHYEGLRHAPYFRGPADRDCPDGRAGADATCRDSLYDAPAQSRGVDRCRQCCDLPDLSARDSPQYLHAAGRHGRVYLHEPRQPRSLPRPGGSVFECAGRG